MADLEGDNQEALADFEPEDGEEEAKKDEAKRDGAGIQMAGFRDFLLRPELNRAIQDCGFEHPSPVQHQCIPHAILGQDILCQAQSGKGKTAVFVLAVLQQLEDTGDDKFVQCLVLCHTRELAYQIAKEFGEERFSKYLPFAKCQVIYGGVPVAADKKKFDTKSADFPNIVVGTPGRTKQLVMNGDLKLNKLKHFVLDECDRMLEKLDMRGDVQEIFMKAQREKQVMMYSATMPQEMRTTAKKFMRNPVEVYVDSESKLTLHGLQQYVVDVNEQQKNRKLNDLLDYLEFNQVVIFVKSVRRAQVLSELLDECKFPVLTVHSAMKQEERIQAYSDFKACKKRLMVATDLMGRGIDIERVNIVINYDMADDADSYLHRVGRAGRFGTKGLAITFVTSEEDKKVMSEVGKRFEVNVTDLPETIDSSSYM